MTSGASFETLMAIHEQLASHGVPRLTPWWRAEAAKFYGHPTARTWVVCAGRGGIKSTALYETALNETLFGDFAIPPGERHWASITSRLKDEGGKGIAIISHWLSLLRVRHTAVDGIIELVDMPRGIRITASSVGGNTGWRSYFSGSDEVGKWPTAGALAVDAAEVLASARAMTATHLNARHMVVSTPFLDSGPFFELVSAGSNDRQVVSGPAATWIANPSISEEQTHHLEPNARVHAREYGAAFGHEWEHGFFVGLIEGAVGPHSSLPYLSGWRYTIAIDPAFSRDLFAIAIAHAEGDTVIVDRIEAITPPRGGEGVSPTACLRRVDTLATEYRCSAVLSDQFSAATLTDLAAREGMTLLPIPWTGPNKAERFDLVRTLMRDRRLRIPNDTPLLRELSGIGVKLTSGGNESIQGRSGYTDDRVAALVLAVAAIAGRWSAPGAKMVAALQAHEARTAANRKLGIFACHEGGDISAHPDFNKFLGMVR